MFCNACGKEIKDGNAFCPYCGTPTGGNGQAANPQMTIQGYNTEGNNQSSNPQAGDTTFNNQGVNQAFNQQGSAPGYNQQGYDYFGGQQYANDQFYGNQGGQVPKKKSHKGAIIAVLLVIVLAIVGVGGYFGYNWYQNHCLETALADGDQEYAKGNYDKAISFYNEALSYDSESTAAIEGIKKSELGNSLAAAKALADEGSYDDAISAYDEILDEYPDNEDAKSGKADAKKAKLLAQIAEDLEIANGYLESKDYEEAIEAYKTVLAEDKSNEEAINGLISAYNAIIDAYIDDKDFEKALEAAQDALKDTGDDSFQTRIDDEISPNIIPDVDDALEAASDYLDDAEYITVSITSNTEFTAKESGYSLSLISKTDGKYYVINKSRNSSEYTNVDVSWSYSDASFIGGSDNLEVYGEGNSYSIQVNGDGWEDDDDSNGLLVCRLSKAAIYDIDYLEDVEIQDSMEEIDGRQCLVITGNLDNEDALYYGAYAEFFLGYGLGDLDDITATVTLYLDSEDMTPVYKEVELSALDMTYVESAMNEALDVEDGEIAVGEATCTFTVSYDSYDELDDLTPSDL